MFESLNIKEKEKKAKEIVTKLNTNNRAHSRHFSADICKSIGLEVDILEADQNLQEKVLSVHHSYIITFEISACTKIIENHRGARFVSHQTMTQPIIQGGIM